jgi:hypothetical protein
MYPQSALTVAVVAAVGKILLYSLAYVERIQCPVRNRFDIGVRFRGRVETPRSQGVVELRRQPANRPGVLMTDRSVPGTGGG